MKLVRAAASGPCHLPVLQRKTKNQTKHKQLNQKQQRNKLYQQQKIEKP